MALNATRSNSCTWQWKFLESAAWRYAKPKAHTGSCLQGCSMNAPRFAKPGLPKNSSWAAPPLRITNCDVSTNVF